MLHIILLILKIIGWILLAVLGILVLLVCVVLFTPFRYAIFGKCDGTLTSLDAEIKFSYLFHLIEGMVRYTDRKLFWKLRIAWKKTGSETAAPEAMKKAAENAAEEAGSTIEEIGNAAESLTEETAAEAETTEEKVAEKLPEAQKESFFEKISYKFGQLCDKMEEILRKKEQITDFLTDEVHTSAFAGVFSELKRCVLRLKPKHLSGNITFGFEDPALTGRLLAGLSILYPYFPEELRLRPQFEEKILKGDIRISGSIAVRIFASMTVRLLLDKNVRRTIQHARKFKLD